MAQFAKLGFLNVVEQVHAVSKDAATTEQAGIDFLCIAGGGGGGFDRGGGAGAGGYRNSFNSDTSGGGGSAEGSLILKGGETYTITVGDGGTGAAGSGAIGGTGGHSVISGSGIDTIE